MAKSKKRRAPAAKRAASRTARVRAGSTARASLPSAQATFEPYAGEDLARLRINVTTMGDLLLTAADRYPETLALVFPDTQLSYAQLAERAMRRARSLRALGVR